MSVSKQHLLTALILLLGISVLAWTVQPRTEFTELRWYSVLPPLAAVVFAIATQHLLLSLFAGVVSGSLLINVPAAPLQAVSWVNSLETFLSLLWNVISDPFNLSVLAFIILMLVMISVVILAGGLQAIVRWLEQFARGPRSTQFVTTLMGFAVFIDDYANVMIVGTSMRPVSDAMRISREKLAFLVDATSAPVAGIALMSTWIGYEIGIFADVSNSLGFERDAYSMFLDALGFRFYCFFMLLFILINVWSRREFGSMLRAEQRSRAGQLLAEEAVPPGLITIMCLAAVLDGAIFGDHCSPISDTTIMSSIATSCDHIHHVHTQFPYASVVALTAIGTGYLPAVSGMPFWQSAILAGLIFLGFLRLFGRKVE